MINVIAYVPFGFFVGLIGRERSPTARLVTGTAAGAVLSFVMESLQMFLPTRDASTVDFVTNTVGSGLGAVTAAALNRAPGLRAKLSEWRDRVFIGGHSGDLGIALLGIWLIAQVNPGIPLFAATFDPSLELTRDFAGTLLQAAQSAFNVIGVVLLLIGSALMLKGCAASVLIRQSVLESWIKPGVSIGVAVGAFALLLAIWLPRPARTTVCAVALLSSLGAPLLAPDMWQARAPLALFDWPYGHLLNFNGLTHAVLVIWPLLASVYLLWLSGRPGWGHTEARV